MLLSATSFILFLIMKHLNIILAFLMTLSAPVSAEDENLFKGKSYGSFMFFANAFNLQKLSSKEFRLFVGGKLGGVKLIILI